MMIKTIIVAINLSLLFAAISAEINAAGGELSPDAVRKSSLKQCQWDKLIMDSTLEEASNISLLCLVFSL